MKVITINAYSYADALDFARAEGITVVKNATKAYNKVKNTDSLDAFCNDYMHKHHLDETSGVGCIIVESAGSADTRERPYKYINNTTVGPLKKKRVFQVRRKSDDSLVYEAESKGDAARGAKSLMKHVKEDLICTQVYKVLGEHEVAFELNYAPSLNTRFGSYIVFGN